MSAAPPAASPRRLVALDIDGTVLHEDGWASSRVRNAITRAVDAGHEVMLATGRSAATTFPVLEQIGLQAEYVVCSNGAITLRRDPAAAFGYRRDTVETFDPSAVLETIHAALPGARYATEDADGTFRYTQDFPTGVLGAASEQVSYEQLLREVATRVVVISPDHGTREFLELVDRMGLHQVSYSVGWTAWLDIAPDGVNKATAMERVRARLGIPPELVIAVGDGRNDLELLRWAGRVGTGVAMGQAPPEVRAAATIVTGTVQEDGLAEVLEALD